MIFTVSGNPLYVGNGVLYSGKNIKGINLWSCGDFYGDNVKIKYYGDFSNTSLDICNAASTVNENSELYLVNSETGYTYDDLNRLETVTEPGNRLN